MADTVAISQNLVRLHITPFNQTLYDKIVPTSIKSTGRNVSFYATQTAPEKGFGYLELPKVEAEALKRKLNGSILKGAKIRIEEARPMKKRKVEADDDGDTEISAVKQNTRKKRIVTEEEPRTKKRDVVLDGYELPASRHVQRGWTEDKSGSRRAKKADAKEQQDSHKVLFKTVVPPNATELKDKTKKRSVKRSDKVKKQKGEVLVEEFAKNRSTFAVSQASSAERKPAVAFEDGIGWVDEDGEVVEAVSARAKQQQQRQQQQQQEQQQRRHIEHIDEMQHHKDSSTIEDETNHLPDETKSSTSNEDITMQEARPALDSDEESVASDIETNPDSDSSDVKASSEDSSEDEDTQPKEVHPLEALYKRAKPSSIQDRLPPIDTSFSFFNSLTEDTMDEDKPTMLPQTPHTKQDLDWRHQRSAAPTPDTAAIDGRFGNPFGNSDDDDDQDEDVETTPTQLALPPQSIPESEPREESAFRKLFYEKRGDLDRAWKKRRRDTKKLQRQRENRRLNRRVV